MAAPSVGVPASAPSAPPGDSFAKAVLQLVPEQPSRWRQLLDYAWLVRLVAGMAPLPCALWAALTLGQGILIPAQLWLTKTLVDSLAAEVAGIGDHTATLWLGLLAAVLLAERALDGVQAWLTTAVREEIGPKLQDQVMRKAAALDVAAFEHQTYYDRLNRVMSDAETRGPPMLGQALGLLRTVLALLGYAVALIALTPLLLAITTAAWAPSLALYFVSGQSHWGLLSKQTRERRLADYNASILTERGFAKEVSLYGLAGYLLDRWSALFWQTRNEQRRLALRLGIKQRASVLAASAVSLLGLLWVVAAGLTRATPGAYALLFQSINGLGQSMLGIANTLKVIGEQFNYASEFRAFLRQPVEAPQAAEPANDPRPAIPSRQVAAPPLRPCPRPLRYGIRVEDVWFIYPGSDRPALAGVSFAIRAGETVALVGENDAGKTTLVKLLLGLYQPDAGRITFDGVDIRDLDPDSLRAAVSAVLQQFTRYQLTFRENVGIAAPDRLHDLDRLRRAVASAGAADILEKLPQGEETLLGPDVGGVDLSGGQWQRLALARAFVRVPLTPNPSPTAGRGEPDATAGASQPARPADGPPLVAPLSLDGTGAGGEGAQLLILDEPTAALDPLAELAVFERFVELARGRTAILISHRLGMARLADRVLVLNHGRLVEAGPHEELIRARGDYARMVAAQARWYA